MSDFISLCRNSDFQRLYHRGKSAVRPTMVMYVGKGQPRYGAAWHYGREESRRRRLPKQGKTPHKRAFSAVCGTDKPENGCLYCSARTHFECMSGVSKKDFLSAASELGLIEVCADNTRNT